ncbi:hypothetical protein B0H13DRAFT_2664041 [Mycena leptocephala]|nr:hypothetical protein B0H13DRAFT_2664041 [Mycena leptocephala]
MRILHLLSFLLLPLPSLHVKPREEESTGGEMTLASLCMTTDFAAGDAHAFGWLRGGLVCPAVLASLRDLGDGGAFSVGHIRMALHAARCTLVIDASALFTALCPFWDCPAYSLLPLLCLILPPTRRLRRPAHPPSVRYTGVAHRDCHHSHVCVGRVRIAIAGIAMSALEVLAELLGCRLRISGEEEKRRGAALYGSRPFSHPAFEVRAARAGMRALVRGGWPVRGARGLR